VRGRHLRFPDLTTDKPLYNNTALRAGWRRKDKNMKEFEPCTPEERFQDLSDLVKEIGMNVGILILMWIRLSLMIRKLPLPGSRNRSDPSK